MARGFIACTAPPAWSQESRRNFYKGRCYQKLACKALGIWLPLGNRQAPKVYLSKVRRHRGGTEILHYARVMTAPTTVRATPILVIALIGGPASLCVFATKAARNARRSCVDVFVLMPAPHTRHRTKTAGWFAQTRSTRNLVGPQAPPAFSRAQLGASGSWF